MKHALLFSVAALSMAASCVQPPGFVPSPVPDGPALFATAALGDAGHADVTIHGRALGALFGVSFHVTTTNATLTDAQATERLALDRTVAFIDGDGDGDGDVAFGGTRLDPAAGDVALEDGALATLHVQAVEAGDVVVRIKRATVRRSDGSFLPVAVAGGTLTLEAAP